jgi:hypothetical protein
MEGLESGIVVHKLESPAWSNEGEEIRIAVVQA